MAAKKTKPEITTKSVPTIDPMQEHHHHSLKSTFLAVVSVLAIILLVWFVFGFTTSDADGDGIFETGEQITFAGDKGDGTIDYDVWEWDFNGDGIYEAQGMVVTHIFDAPGQYNVILREGSTDFDYYNGQAQIVDIVIPVEPPATEPQEPGKSGDAKNNFNKRKALAYGITRCMKEHACVNGKKVYALERVMQAKAKIAFKWGRK